MYGATWVLGLVLVGWSDSAFGINCDTIEGIWYNQLGSELILTKIGESLKGELRTAVEMDHGSAGDSHGDVKGIQANWGFSDALAFSVVFNGGQSVTSWLGQCTKCGEDEVLKTTWLLKSSQDTCIDNWKSTVINEDVFMRIPTRGGPRKHEGTNTPKRSYKSVLKMAAYSRNDVTSIFGHNLRGKWYADDGTELELYSNDDNGTLHGTYRGRDESAMSVHGNFEPNSGTGIFGLYATLEDRSAAQVSVGQFHKCDDNTVILATSWLHRTISESCDGDSVSYQKTIFKRTPPSSEHEEKSATFFSGITKGLNKFTNYVSKWFS